MLTWFLLGCALLSASACADDGSCGEQHSCCSGHRCCPLEKAVCCADLLHCCPRGQTCNLKLKRCENSVGSSPWVEKIPVIHGREVRCNQTAFCHDGSTCCRTVHQQWACCPFPQAVCCADLLHCCPRGQTCNLILKRCENPEGSSPWVEKIPVIHRREVKDVSPPERESFPASFAQATPPGMQEASDEDEKAKLSVKCDAWSSCPDLTTCCFMDKLQIWGCCPLPNAVCCPGGMYCCPQQHTCNLHTKQCVRGDEPASPALPKVPARIKGVELRFGSRRCDGTSVCPAHTTCCPLPVGGWGCCPLDNAVCCSESGSCCPLGSRCAQTGQCLVSDRSDRSLGDSLRSKGQDDNFM